MIKALPSTMFTVAILILSTATTHANDGQAHTPYTGQQLRSIKSLSPEDIAALEAGRGWGFAKPAELNGYPGPLHVLELDQQLGLTDDQRRHIETIFDKMKTSAQKAGAVFLAAERALDAAFTNNVATPAAIAGLTLASAKARAELQRIHLEAHLLTTPLLTETQRRRYKALRGYSSASGSTHGSHSGQASKKAKGSHRGN